MKILSGTVPVSNPDPATSSEKRPASPAELPTEDFKAILEEFVEHTMGEIRSLRERFEKAHAEDTGSMRENGQAITKLAEEMDGLRIAVANIRSEKPAVPPPVQDPGVMKALGDMAQQINRLSQELGVMRQAIETLQAASKPADPPPPPVPPDKRDLFLERISGSVPEEPAERKVAFLTKLWDYLNEVAFEIPLRKND